MCAASTLYEDMKFGVFCSALVRACDSGLKKVHLTGCARYDFGIGVCHRSLADKGLNGL